MHAIKSLAAIAAVVTGALLISPASRAETRIEYIGRIIYNDMKKGYCGGPTPCPLQGVRVGEFAYLTYIVNDTGMAGFTVACPNPIYVPEEYEHAIIDGSYFTMMGGVRLAAPVVPGQLPGQTNPAVVIDYQNCTVDQLNIKGAALFGQGGACCYPSGACTYVLQSECTAPGTTWTFGGACMSINSCSQPLGVCCASDNSCTMTTSATCTGVTWSYGGTCSSDPCPHSTGACCNADGSCVITTAAFCAGVWTAGSPCSFTLCTPAPYNWAYGTAELRIGGPTGFFTSGQISQNRRAYTTFGPDYQFWTISVACGDARGQKGFNLGVPVLAAAFTDASTPLGACCPGDGHCLLTSQTLCTASSIAGLWAPGACSPNPCPSTAGACCFANGTCQLVLQSVCLAGAGNQYLGNTSACIAGACPQSGGCCVAGVCSIMSQLGCAAASGTWRGSGSSCDPTPQVVSDLFSPTGSCCSSVNGMCKIVFQTACTGSTNTWTANATCAAPCPNSGRCCFPFTGLCELLNSANCTNRNGVFTLGETCAAPCDVAMGACCNPVSGVCSVVIQSACVCGGDIWAEGQTCSQLCPVVVGACCNTQDGSCFMVSQEYCSGAVEWRSGVVCSAGPCQGSAKILPDAVFIPGNPGTTVPAEFIDPIIVTGPGTVLSVDVWIDMTSSRLNDFKISLIAPNSAEAILFSRIGSVAPCTVTPIGPGHTLNGIYVFKDSAAQSLWSHVANNLTTPFITPTTPGVYRASECAGSPVSLSTAFGGLPKAGVWQLKVRDERSGINLQVRSWGLSFNQSASPQVCSPTCPADFNNSGAVTVQDIFDFLSAWFALLPSADFNGVSGITVQDIFDFLTAWFAGC